MSYKITLPDTEAVTFADLTTAREWAQAEAKARTLELDVVHVETGVVAFVATHVEGRYFHPFERVETPRFAAPHFEGYRAAYTRKRIEATVYRSLDERAWLVHDGRTGGHQVVATTKAACALTKAMRQGLTL